MGETLAQAAIGRHGAGQDEWELTQLLRVLESWGWPRLVVEIGCDRGGTLWLWRELGAQVVAITLHKRTDGMFDSHGAYVVEGDSTDVYARNAVRELLDGRAPDLVFVDGGHDYQTALADIRWAFELAPRGLVVVHDINRRIGHPEIETFMAWTELADDRAAITIRRTGEGSPGTGVIFPRGVSGG